MSTTIEERVIQLLPDVAGQLHAARDESTRNWTREIKSRLCTLGKELKYEVSASGCSGADYGEWLFDLVWSTGEGDELHELPLVVESVWRLATDAITLDFGKLVVAKAPVKLFILQQPTAEDVVRVVALLRRLARAFRAHLPRERYILAGYSFGEPKGFSIEKLDV